MGADWRASKGKIVNQTAIVHAGFFAFRTPLLPIEELRGWGDGLTATAHVGEAGRLDAALAADRGRIRARLKQLIALPEVREALFVASPSLEESLGLWRDDPDGERGQKIERSLIRYLQRMAGRSTPFGLFAGTSLGCIGDNTRIQVEGREQCRRHTRLDMGYVCALAEHLERQPELKKTLRYVPNSSLHRSAGRWSYFESRWKGKRVLRLVGVEDSPYLTATLERARAGATIRELAEPLVDPEVSVAEAEGFVAELIDTQILVSGMLPSVTGPEPIHGMVELLEAGGGQAAAQRLEQTHAALQEIDAGGWTDRRASYRAVSEALKAFPVEIDPARLVQVDLFKPATDASIGMPVIDEILRGIRLLHRLQDGKGRDPWSAFKSDFLQRYEGQEVPLCEVLDEEVGIGFEKSTAPAAEASPLLVGLAFPGGAAPAMPWTSAQMLAIRKHEEALRLGLHEVAIRDSDLEDLAPGSGPPLPDVFSVFGTLHAASEEAVAAGNYRFRLQYAGGPSGVQMLGRFCHLDEELGAKVREYLAREEAFRPDAVFAEIVHLPPGRTGNVIARPMLRKYEIPYLGRAAVAPEFQIPVTDLLVSVRGGRVVLRSRRLGREVLPRMTNAHNVSTTGLGLYKFLERIQHQGVQGHLKWDWGAWSACRFLPRLVYGRLILSPARWRIAREEIAALAVRGGGERFRAAQELRRVLALPRFVAVEDADNTLPVDLDNVLSVETFIHLVKDRPSAQLIELRIGPEDVLARGPEGGYVHEVLIPFLRVQSDRAPSAPIAVERKPVPAAPPTTEIPRRIAPGEEFLYAKLYSGTSTADRVLREVVLPVAQRAMQSGAADHWHFVRYGDPDWHVRVRFHGDPDRLLGQVFGDLRRAVEPHRKEGAVYRLELDTYHREVERYGGPAGMLLSERIFHVDSEAAIGIVDRIAGDEGLDARWRLAMVGMDLLLNDLSFDLEGKLSLLDRIRDSFRVEFSASGPLEEQIGQKFREERAILEVMLSPDQRQRLPIGPGIEVLLDRSRRMAPIAAELRQAEREGRLTAPIGDLAASYLHMHANRLLRSAARSQELVMYDFLARLYRAQWARGRKGRA